MKGKDFLCAPGNSFIHWNSALTLKSYGQMHFKRPLLLKNILSLKENEKWHLFSIFKKELMFLKSLKLKLKYLF